MVVRTNRCGYFSIHIYILNFAAERLHFLCEVLKIILTIFQYKVSSAIDHDSYD